MLNSSLMMSLRTIEFLRVCDWILQVYVLCDVNWKGRSWKASHISFSFFFFFLSFYLNQMFKWIYTSFVIETSLRRFAPLITLYWCNTTVVFIDTRLSFSVCLDWIKSYRISMCDLFDLSKKGDNHIFIEKTRRADPPWLSSMLPFEFYLGLLSFLFILPYIFYIWCYVMESFMQP